RASAILHSVKAANAWLSEPVTVGAPRDCVGGRRERATGELQKPKEEHRMEQTAQYDHIGSKYDEYAQTATLKRAESYTFFRMVRKLAGQCILDLACGFGFYTRQLKQRGAAQVVGIDLSPEMVRLARAKERDDPTGSEYRVGDATHLPVLSRFDLVTAVYLLNYATSKD